MSRWISILWVGTAFTILVARPVPAAAQDARQIMEEAQKRTQATSQHYEGLLQVIDSKGKITDKRWVYDRLGSHGRSKSVLRFIQPGRGERRGAARRQPSRTGRRTSGCGRRPSTRAAHRAAGPLDALLRHRLQLRGSRRARRGAVRLRDARRGEPSTASPAGRSSRARGKTKSSQYTSSHRLGPQGQLRVPADRELHQGRTWCGGSSTEDSRTCRASGPARVLEMADLRRNSRTILTLEKLQYNVPMKDEDFTLQALRRDSRKSQSGWTQRSAAQQTGQMRSPGAAVAGRGAPRRHPTRPSAPAMHLSRPADRRAGRWPDPPAPSRSCCHGASLPAAPRRRWSPRRASPRRRATGYPQTTANDNTQVVGEALLRVRGGGEAGLVAPGERIRRRPRGHARADGVGRHRLERPVAEAARSAPSGAWTPRSREAR